MLIGRYRLFMRGENETVRVIEIAGPLPFSVFCQFMITTGKVADIFEGFSSPEIVEPRLEHLSTLRTQLPNGQPVVVGVLFQTFIPKGYVHRKDNTINTYYSSKNPESPSTIEKFQSLFRRFSDHQQLLVVTAEVPVLFFLHHSGVLIRQRHARQVQFAFESFLAQRAVERFQIAQTASSAQAALGSTP